MKKFHAKTTIFGLITAYQACLFCMAFVFLILVFFIDHYCVGVSNEHCTLSFFFISPVANIALFIFDLQMFIQLA